MIRSFLFVFALLFFPLKAFAQPVEEPQCTFPRCNIHRCHANQTNEFADLVGLDRSAFNLAATNHTVEERIRAVSSCSQIPFYDYSSSPKNPYAFLVLLHYVSDKTEKRFTEEPSSLCFLYEIDRGDMSASPTSIDEAVKTSPIEDNQQKSNHTYLYSFDIKRPADTVFSPDRTPAWEEHYFTPQQPSLKTLEATRKTLGGKAVSSDALDKSLTWYLNGQSHPVTKSKSFQAFLADKKENAAFADCFR